MTKYRSGVFTKEILDDLHPIFSSVCYDFESELVEFDGEDDYVHLLVNYPPKVAVSKLLSSLKGISSLMIRKKNIRVFKRSCGVALGGRPDISLVAAAVPILLLFENTSSNSKHRTKSKVQGKEGFATSPP